MDLESERLTLVPMTGPLVRLEIGDLAGFAAALDAEVPDGWPPESVRHALEFFAQNLEANPNNSGWAAYYWLHRQPGLQPPLLVGSGGFHRAPDSDGTAEIGYGTLERFHNRGYATEAVKELVAWATGQPNCRRVIAHAEPTNLASIRVLTKSGFDLEPEPCPDGKLRFTFQAP